MEEDQVVGMPEILHFLDDRIIGGIAEADAPAELLLAALHQEIERAALPRLRRLALVAAAIIAHRFFDGTIVAPEEDAALVHWMQGVDEHQPAVDRQADRIALHAERPQQIGLWSAFQAAADDPVGKAVDVGDVHRCNVGIARCDASRRARGNGRQRDGPAPPLPAMALP